jgi:hypothetical protein
MAQRKQYKQGIFTPRNKSKCTSSLCLYRSGLELSYMRWLDENSNIVSWGSEKIIIPYLKPTDGKMHKYFIDFNFTIKDTKGELHKFLIEIKPAKQCQPPTTHGNKKPKTILYENIQWATNSQKWAAAKAWADKHGYKFTIVTEKDIKNLK